MVVSASTAPYYDIWSFFTHHYTMPYFWSFSINLAVLVVIYKYRPLWMLAHIIIAGGIGFMTVLTGYPFLMVGIPPVETVHFLQRHFYIGLVCLPIVLIQLILGIIPSILKLIPSSSPFAIYGFNTVHKYWGYLTLIICKIQCYSLLQTNGNHPELFGLLIASEVIFIFLYVLRAFRFPTMASSIVPKYEEK